MMRLGLLIPALAILLLPGCSLLHPNPRPSNEKLREPWDAYDSFRQRIHDGTYDKAYQILTRDTQKRYQFWEFNMMMGQTRFGRLLYSILGTWELRGIRLSPDGRRAWIQIQHPEFPDYRKEVEVVKEGETDSWRIRFTLAWALGIPEEEERRMFPKDFEEAPAEPPHKSINRSEGR